MKRFLVWFVYLGIVVGLGLLSGCASSVKKVAGYQNNYDFREARYEEACALTKPPLPPSCHDLWAKIRAFEKHLHEAAKALQNGGPMPLQLGQLAADDKTVKKAADSVAKEGAK